VNINTVKFYTDNDYSIWIGKNRIVSFIFYTMADIIVLSTEYRVLKYVILFQDEFRFVFFIVIS